MRYIWNESDGFVRLDDPDNLDATSNLERFRDEFSPFSGEGLSTAVPSSNVIADSFYGYTFSTEAGMVTAPYGMTSELLGEPRRDLFASRIAENFGYLRIPFRRIPRWRISSRRQLELLLNCYGQRPERTVLLRGQSREYALPRSPEARTALYGTADVVEPSLLSSAERASLNLTHVLPEWSAFVQHYLLYIRDTRFGSSEPEMGSTTAASELRSIFNTQRDNLCSGYGIHLLSLVLAQHYGYLAVALIPPTVLNPHFFSPSTNL